MSVGLSDLTYGPLADENDNYLIDNVVFTNTNYVPTEEISGADMAEDVSDPTYDPELEENYELMNTNDEPPEETINGELSEINVRKRKRRGKQQDWNKYKNITNRLGGKEYNGRKKIDGVWSYNINKPARGLKKHVIVFLKLRIIVNLSVKIFLNCREKNYLNIIGAWIVKKQDNNI